MIRLLSAILLLAAIAQAQVVEMVPEAKAMPAPDWVKPGVRVTWHEMSAGRGGKYTSKNPFAHPSRQRFDKDGNPYTLNKGSSYGAQIYTEVTIVAVEAKRFVFEVRKYELPTGGAKGPGILIVTSGGICKTPGTLNGYWLHPNALRTLLARGSGGGYTVAKLKHPVGSDKVDAVHIAMTDEKTNFSWVYDLNSGVLLQQSHFQRGTRGFGGKLANGDDYSGSYWGGRATTFREFTEVKLPWLGGSVPPWVARVKAVDFQTGRFAAGMPAPKSWRFEPVEVGKTWALLRQQIIRGPREWLDHTHFRGMPIARITGPFVSGAGSPSGLWIPPEHIGRLTKGQEICANPVTEFRVTVAYVGPERGSDVCVIRWHNRQQTIDYVYDRKSGGLLRTTTTNRYVGTKETFVMTGTR